MGASRKKSVSDHHIPEHARLLKGIVEGDYVESKKMKRPALLFCHLTSRAPNCKQDGGLWQVAPLQLIVNLVPPQRKLIFFMTSAAEVGLFYVF